jgi:hypothetical protein
MKVKADFTPRGNVHTVVEVTHKKDAKWPGAMLNFWDGEPNRGRYKLKLKSKRDRFRQAIAVSLLPSLESFDPKPP